MFLHKEVFSTTICFISFQFCSHYFSVYLPLVPFPANEGTGDTCHNKPVQQAHMWRLATMTANPRPGLSLTPAEWSHYCSWMQMATDHLRQNFIMLPLCMWVHICVTLLCVK